ncbi:TPA: hypothetical protein JBI64_12800 [Legionella pneumophila]|nr:hypothetical protein [Legionella pneumophila]
MSKQLLNSLPEFFLSSPLYKIHSLAADKKILSYLYGREDLSPFDGHCPFCNKETTYKLSEIQHIPGGDPWRDINEHIGFGEVAITCSRDDLHRIVFFFFLSNLSIQKVGQLPSLADIANDEIKKYRKQMSDKDGAEFHKAIGLAAHGIGVGSYVYLRRVFERLILNRFHEVKDKNSWNEVEFKVKRMEEKITFLRDYLPEFLVTNSKIYSVLSQGIHELEEDQCLANFDILKTSIIIILEDDNRKKEELSLRKRLEKSISGI